MFMQQNFSLKGPLTTFPVKFKGPFEDKGPLKVLCNRPSNLLDYSPKPSRPALLRPWATHWQRIGQHR